jgi:hypothetical protein
VLEIPPGESRRVAFVLGQGRDEAHASELAARYASVAQAEAALAASERAWDDMLDVVQVQTPDDVTVSNPDQQCRGIAVAALDGLPVDANAIPIEDDGGVHEVTIVLGSASDPGHEAGAMGGAARRTGS